MKPRTLNVKRQQKVKNNYVSDFSLTSNRRLHPINTSVLKTILHTSKAVLKITKIIIIKSYTYTVDITAYV